MSSRVRRIECAMAEIQVIVIRVWRKLLVNYLSPSEFIDNLIPFFASNYLINLFAPYKLFGDPEERP